MQNDSIDLVCLLMFCWSLAEKKLLLMLWLWFNYYSASFWAAKHMFDVLFDDLILPLFFFS